MRQEDRGLIDAAAPQPLPGVDQGGERKRDGDGDRYDAKGDDGGVEDRFEKQRVARQLDEVGETDERLAPRDDIPLEEAEPQRLDDRIDADTAIEA
ncbi:hypothetical protein ACVWXN_000985 [Bradyrhizobium sp. i1.4.4]